MNFCPECNYVIDIEKDEKKQEEILDKINILFDLLNNDKSLDDYYIDIDKNEIIKNKKYQKLSENSKKKIEKYYDNINSKNNIIFVCKNCNYRKKIEETTLLYKVELSEKKIFESNENNKFLILNDPLLPRTSNYICVNKKCATHKDYTLKEAVFFKDDNNKIRYLCTKCKFSF